MATERTIKIKVDKQGADNSVKELDNNIKKTDKSTSGLSSSLDKMTGGAVSGFKAMKAGLVSSIKSFKSLRVAIIGTGIGALIIAILAVKQAFTSSEEGQNKFAKIMAVIGSITGNLSDLLSNLGMRIISVFENPKQSIKDFANLIKDNIINRFQGILELIPMLGKSIKQLFKGDFSGAAETATNAVAKVVLGTDNLTDSIRGASNALKTLGKEVADDAKKSADIADKRAKADVIERNLIVERAKANRNIAELRFKSEQRDKFSAEERVNFLKQASKIDEEITGKEIAAAKLRAEAKIAENKLSNSTKEDLTEEENLKAKVIQLDIQRLNLAKRLQTQIQTAQNEVKAQMTAEAKIKQGALDKEEKERIESIEKEGKSEEERLNKIAKIQDEFKLKREEELAETELQKIELEKERKLKELEDLKASEQAKADVVSFYDNKIAKQKTKEAGQEISLADTVREAKENIANRTANLLIQLGGKAAKVGKAIAVAQTIRKGIEGVQSAYTTAQKSPYTIVNPAYPLIQAGLSGAFSALQVKKILSTSDTGGGGGSAGSVGGGTSAPSFNLVQGTPQNQLAQSLSNSANRPVETFVVSGNVTTAQSADRNKIDEGSL